MLVITRVCLSVCLSAAPCPHYCMDLDAPWGDGRGCPLVVHCWEDLQSLHGLRCYGNIARTRNVSECLYSFYAWLSLSLLFTTQCRCLRTLHLARSLSVRRRSRWTCLHIRALANIKSLLKVSFHHFTLKTFTSTEQIVSQ